MKYVGYYDNNPDRRIVSPAAVDKMDYIAKVVSRVCGCTEILSCATYSSVADRCHREQISELVSVKYMRTRRMHQLIIGKGFDFLYDRIGVFVFLWKNIKRGETVIVYHSLLNMSAICLIKKLKKIKLILEVEEIYNDVGGLSKDTRKKELDYIEEDLLFCDRKIPYTNKFYIGDFSVRITINELR